MDNKIKSFISSPENQYLERKSARVEQLDILKHLVAFANADGGSLVIGVEDNGEITAFNNSKARKIEEFKNIALIKLKDSPILPKYEIFDVKNKKGEEDKILVISVEPAYDRVIKSYDNNVYLRQFDKTEKLNHEQITQLEYDRGQRYLEDDVNIGVIVKNDTLLLTQKSIAELFGVGVPAISKHLKKSMNLRNLKKIRLFPK